MTKAYSLILWHFGPFRGLCFGRSFWLLSWLVRSLWRACPDCSVSNWRFLFSFCVFDFGRCPFVGFDFRVPV